MFFTGFRRAATVCGGLALAVASHGVLAGDGMPPLRMHPLLLGAPVDASPLPPATAPQALPAANRSPAPAAAPPVALPPVAAVTAPAVGERDASATYVVADRIEGVNDVETHAIGHAELARGTDRLRAERIVFRVADDEVEASGDVRLTTPDAEIDGARLRLRMDERSGEFVSPRYVIRRAQPPVDEPALTLSGLPAVNENGTVLVSSGRKLPRPPVVGSGSAAALTFLGKDRYAFKDATYSTCEPDRRDWEVDVDALELDYVDMQGSGRNARVSFKDTPLFYAPWLTFPLDNRRKSGLLPGTVGSTSKGGFEVTAPWYWNIAPNIDATLTPRLMTRRGLQFNGELRYLLDSTANRAVPAGVRSPDQGQLRIEYLPDDRLAQRERYGVALAHTQYLGNGFTAALNFNGVSDDDYFSDLSTRIAQVSQGNLLRQAIVTYGGPWYGASFNLQSYQTLQNLERPYRRLPQINLTAQRYDLPANLAVQVSGEFVHYDHDTLLTGKRTTFYPQLAWPFATAAAHLTPKLGMHATHYALDQHLPAGTEHSYRRSVPVFSVDGGAFLERDTDWFGQTLVQTLEPRAYYVYVPTEDQRNLPIFDTARAEFNYASMFAENRYVGGDRIGNANELTLAVTSRLLDPHSGSDLLRATLGQRFYFAADDALASLPDESLRTSRKADLLAALTGKVWPHTYADAAWQFSPDSSRTERFTLGGRYRPTLGKIFNAAYRYVRDPATDKAALEQIDVSGQWPLAGGWHGVGRYNYSLQEDRIVEMIGGLEYNAGCWVGRFVVQRLATIADQPTSSVFVQLELNDFSRIGSNPLQLLRRNIPGYGVINQPTADPVFAED